MRAPSFDKFLETVKEQSAKQKKAAPVILGILLERGALAVPELAALANMDLQQFTEELSRLQNLGLVARAKEKVELTADGQAMVSQARK